jgi:hypothetical protein
VEWAPSQWDIRAGGCQVPAPAITSGPRPKVTRVLAGCSPRHPPGVAPPQTAPTRPSCSESRRKSPPMPALMRWGRGRVRRRRGGIGGACHARDCSRCSAGSSLRDLALQCAPRQAATLTYSTHRWRAACNIQHVQTREQSCFKHCRLLHAGHRACSTFARTRYCVLYNADRLPVRDETVHRLGPPQLA